MRFPRSPGNGRNTSGSGRSRTPAATIQSRGRGSGTSGLTGEKEPVGGQAGGLESLDHRTQLSVGQRPEHSEPSLRSGLGNGLDQRRRADLGEAVSVDNQVGNDKVVLRAGMR